MERRRRALGDVPRYFAETLTDMAEAAGEPEMPL